MIDPPFPLWHLELLGQMRLTQSGAPDAPITRFRSRKTATLLAFLALRRGPHRREALAEMLWPETDPQRARNSLRVALFSLRALLETPEIALESAASIATASIATGTAASTTGAVLQISRDSVALGAALTTDVELFRHALVAARSMVSDTTTAASTSPVADEAALGARRRAALEEALQWYRAPLVILEEADDLNGEDNRLEDEFVGALTELVAVCEAQQQFQSALDHARRGLTKAPLREEIALEVLRLSLALNNPEAARDFKKWCARAQKQGISVTNSTLQKARALENLPFASRSKGRSDARATRQCDTPRVCGLPSSWTKCYGREAEIAALQGILQQGARLITLTGAGGVGKTALALQVARRLAAQDPAEFGLIAWVSLADLPVAARIPAALAEALNFPQSTSPNASPGIASKTRRSNAPSFERQNTFWPATVAALRAAKSEVGGVPDNGRILLILDGFEHLCDDGAPLVREWLGAMPELTCLLTSRRALGFAGEVRSEVLPLKFAPLAEATGEVKTESSATNQLALSQTARSETKISVAATALAAATALFLDRARLVRPAWVPTPEDQEIISLLCAYLQGLPLALEIAAARLSLFSPSQILAEIKASKGERSGDSIDFSSALNWKNSDRAAPSRQTSLRASIAWSERQLPLAAARFWRQISVFRGGFTLDAASQICALDAAPLVMVLAEASLLRLDTGGATARAVQLEIERQYAASLLDEAETTVLEARHAEYFADWSASQNTDSAALEAERFNLERARIWLSRQANATNLFEAQPVAP